MRIEDFILKIGSKGDFGVFPPPLTDTEALDILKEHFLGSEWRTENPISGEQANTEMVYDILRTVSERDLKILYIIRKVF